LAAAVPFCPLALLLVRPSVTVATQVSLHGRVRLHPYLPERQFPYGEVQLSAVAAGCASAHSTTIGARGLNTQAAF
jgi:hypothetical protein